MRSVRHQTSNAVLAAPPGLGTDQCDALPVTRITFADGPEGVVSFWRPNDEELALLAKGACVRLTVLGVTHPPIAVGVDGDGGVFL